MRGPPLNRIAAVVRSVCSSRLSTDEEACAVLIDLGRTDDYYGRFVPTVTRLRILDPKAGEEWE